MRTTSRFGGGIAGSSPEPGSRARSWPSRWARRTRRRTRPLAPRARRRRPSATRGTTKGAPSLSTRASRSRAAARSPHARSRIDANLWSFSRSAKYSSLTLNRRASLMRSLTGHARRRPPSLASPRSPRRGRAPGEPGAIGRQVDRRDPLLQIDRPTGLQQLRHQARQHLALHALEVACITAIASSPAPGDPAPRGTAGRTA